MVVVVVVLVVVVGGPFMQLRPSPPENPHI